MRAVLPFFSSMIATIVVGVVVTFIIAVILMVVRALKIVIIVRNRDTMVESALSIVFC